MYGFGDPLPELHFLAVFSVKSSVVKSLLCGAKSEG